MAGETETTRGGPGCLTAVILALWIAGTALAIYAATWLSEQFSVAAGQDWPRANWAWATAIHIGAAGLPALVAAARARDLRYRAVFRGWALAAGFALLLLPVRLAGPTAAQKAALLQIGCVLLYLGLLALARRRALKAAVTAPAADDEPPALRRRDRLARALLPAAVLAVPWVAWGALGSPVDTLLNFIAALLFGLAAAWTVAGCLPPRETAGSVALGGLALAGALAVAGPAFGANNQQMILLFLLPALGWVAAGVAHWGRAGWRAAGLFLGLAVAAPLLFIDPDELALIINLGSRDVGYYAAYATLLGLAGGLILGLPALLVGSRLPGGRGRWLPVTAAVLAAGGLAALFLLVGQPGWHGERLFVILRDENDVRTASAFTDPAARRDYVYRTLTGHALATQVGLREALDLIRVDYTPYYLTNGLEVDGGPLLRLWLANRPEVDRVLDNPQMRPLPEPPSASGFGMTVVDAPDAPPWNLAAIGAPEVWQQLGVRGAGIIIGQADSGVDGTHPELSAQYRGNRPGGPAGDDYNWLDPWYGANSPTDRGGHGTHTLGTALGRTVGVAPDATWIGCVNLARNLGNPARYLDCLQFLFAPYPQGGDPFADGRPELGAHVFNNSWGCPEMEGCDANALLGAMRALRAAGVFVVASAGNSGDGCSSVDAPIALYDDVFTVGATDSDGLLASFSSRGPVTADGSGRIKPDVVAPGVGVVSSFPGGGYAALDGTSMAGPHVAGVVALLWSADPALIGDVGTTERILTDTARPYTSDRPTDTTCGGTAPNPDNLAGFGLVNALDAVSSILK